MIVSCPECSSKFRLPTDALGEKGRKVRCSSCRHTWFQEPELDLAVEVEDDRGANGDGGDLTNTDSAKEAASSDFPEPSPLDDDFIEPGATKSKRPKSFAPDKGKEKKKGKGGLIAWVLLLLLGGGVTYGLADQSARVMIVDNVPQTMKLYDLLDLEVYTVGHGLKIENQDLERGVRDGVKVVTLKGKILNKLEKQVVVPKLIGWLSDNSGSAVSRKTITMDVPFLGPKEEIEFFIELVSSSKAVDVNTSFISEDDALKNPDFDPVDE